MPIQKREESGAEFSGIIDLLATGAGKCLILKHKNGGGNFAGYFAQLQAYRELLAEKDWAIKHGWKFTGLIDRKLNFIVIASDLGFFKTAEGR